MVFFEHPAAHPRHRIKIKQSTIRKDLTGISISPMILVGVIDSDNILGIFFPLCQLPDDEAKERNHMTTLNSILKTNALRQTQVCYRI
jgi:hypothetical protein